jgi:hypothetical protein
MVAYTRIALLALATFIVTWSASAAAQGGMLRTFTLERLHLDRGELVAFTLHPSAVPIEVRSSQRKLEVCPSGALGDATLGLPGEHGSSWPSSSGFTSCLSLDRRGRLTLPSVGSSAFHLGFVVRGRDGLAADIGLLVIEYQAQDGYFFCIPPPIDPGRDRTRYVVTPKQSKTVGADAFASYETDRAPAIHLRVTQRGRTLQPRTQREDGGSPYPPYAARTGKRVVLTLRNTAEAAQPAALAVDWS